jgi:hypothetical protein
VEHHLLSISFVAIKTLLATYGNVQYELLVTSESPTLSPSHPTSP